MKLRVNSTSIEIVPEGPADEAYLEHVIGLHENGASAPLRRVNAFGTHSWAYASVKSVILRKMDKEAQPTDDLIESAWGVIANAGAGNWERETVEWQEAAARWRGRYHAWLGVPSVVARET